MARVETVAGRRFGRLIAIRRVGTRHGNALWLASCECGNTTLARRDHLKSGGTQSCGCLAAENRLLGRRAGHGQSGTPAHKSWHRMVARRGDRVVLRWRTSFAAFFADLGPRPLGTELRRLDPERRYAPGNVAWAPR